MSVPNSFHNMHFIYASMDQFHQLVYDNLLKALEVVTSVIQKLFLQPEQKKWELLF